MTIGSDEWNKANEVFLRKFDGMSDREVIEHFAVVNWIDPDMSTPAIIHALVCYNMNLSLDPTVSTDAVKLYEQGYEDGSLDKPRRFTPISTIAWYKESRKVDDEYKISNT